MSLKITKDCTNCSACEPECPNGAIYLGDEIYEIDPNLCTECVGSYDESQCVVVCPADCIEILEKETKEQLQKKFNKIQQK